MEQEFKIKSKPEYLFRIKKMSPIKLLAFQSVINFDDMKKTEQMFSIILENIEVKIKDSWLPVKEQGRDVYYPIGIEENLNTLMELSTYFLNEVIKPLFQKSGE